VKEKNGAWILYVSNVFVSFVEVNVQTADIFVFMQCTAVTIKCVLVHTHGLV
jgi:hypothetical protein